MTVSTDEVNYIGVNSKHKRPVYIVAGKESCIWADANVRHLDITVSGSGHTGCGCPGPTTVELQWLEHLWDHEN